MVDVSRNKIDTAAIAGGWERYIDRSGQQSCAGREKAIVLAGSDRRGTAYGLLSFSKAIGVSPCVLLGGGRVQSNSKRNKLVLKSISFISKTPSVKFRGIFINDDEDWGLYRWSKRNF